LNALHKNNNGQQYENLVDRTMAATASANDSHRTMMEDDMQDDIILSPVRQKRMWLENKFKQDFYEGRPRPRPGHDLVDERHKWIEEEARRNRQAAIHNPEIVVSQGVLEAKKKWLSDDERIKDERQLHHFRQLPPLSPPSRTAPREDRSEVDSPGRAIPGSEDSIRDIPKENAQQGKAKEPARMSPFKRMQRKRMQRDPVKSQRQQDELSLDADDCQVIQVAIDSLDRSLPQMDGKKESQSTLAVEDDVYDQGMALLKTSKARTAKKSPKKSGTTPSKQKGQENTGAQPLEKKRAPLEDDCGAVETQCLDQCVIL
jgi:hypothetical protein